ncbi:MAG: carbohydrate ABC transporter substrate-binding protein [Lachnospiraceae bacterium]|nr:carbohydrate ABC transporter substrate-binding protein [Lachnospiraceae bacterium]
MKGKTGKGILSAILAVSLCMGLTGCGTFGSRSAEQDGKQAVSDEAIDITSNKGDASQNTGMGRYVEKTVYEMDSVFTMANRVLNDGSFLFTDCTSGKKYVSNDSGDTWEAVQDERYAQFVEEHYAVESAVSADGVIAMINMEAKEDAGNGEKQDYDFVCNVFYGDDASKRISLELPSDSMGCRNLTFDENGRLYVSAYSCDTIYEVDINGGTSKKLVDIPGGVEIMECRGNILMCATYEKTYLYDLENQSFIEDEVLNDFIHENYNGVEWYGSGYSAFVFLGEENVIYVAGEKGLHRHAIGGSTMEQVIDGGLSSFGDPSHSIMTAMMNDRQEFIAVFNDGKFVKFTYDENVSTVPEGKLTVYGLKEDAVVRQAISAYQTAYPDMYIEYETGMEEGGVTREDALKKLNTELMSGNGPDVLLLDDMSIDTYIEKGVLMELSEIVNTIDAEEGLFMNLIESVNQGTGIYAVPAQFRIPFIAGHEDTIQGVEDYQTFADMVEKVRADYPDTNLLMTCSASGIMKRMLTVCEPSWKDTDGQVDKNRIKEFLQETKRIYDAQMNGTPKNEIENYLENAAESDIEDSIYLTQMNNFDYYIGITPFLWGEPMGYVSFLDMISMAKNSGFEDTIYRVMDGQSSNVYHPSTIAGINAAANSSGQAKQFIEILLSPEVQDVPSIGFPMNKKSFVNQFEYEESKLGEDGGLYYMGGSSQDGLEVNYTVYPASADEVSALEKVIASLTTPYIQDSVLETAVIVEGEKYFQGEQDLDTAVSRIMESAALYTME